MLPLHAGQGVGGVIELVDGVTLTLEIDLHQVGDGGLVIYH